MKKSRRFLRKQLISMLTIVILIATALPPLNINAASNTKPVLVQTYNYSYVGDSNTYTVNNVKKGYTVQWSISKALKNYVSFSDSKKIITKTVEVNGTTSKIKVFTLKDAKNKINHKYKVTAAVYDIKGKKVATYSDEVKISIHAKEIIINNYPSNYVMSVNSFYTFHSTLIPEKSANQTFWIITDEKDNILVDTKAHIKSYKVIMENNGIFSPKVAGTYKIYAVAYRNSKATIQRAKSKAVEIQVYDTSVPTITPTITITPVPTSIPVIIIPVVTTPPVAPTYALTIQATEGGSITAGTSGNYSKAATISISAIPHDGYVFGGWSSSNGGTFGNASQVSTEFIMPNNNTTITARFLIDTNTIYTRGQWIQLLADKLGFDYSSVEAEEFDYKYADTETSEYGLAIEIAEAYGILPTPDSEGYLDPEQDIPFFRPEATATREFAAFTIVKAMGFMGEYSILCDDVDTFKYPNEDAIAILQGFLTLNENKFNPGLPLSLTDKIRIFAVIDSINASTIVDVSNPHEDVTLAEGVIRDDLSNVKDYSIVYNGDSTITVTLPNNIATSAISIGNVFVLPPNNEYITGIALKAVSINNLENDYLELICSKPDIAEVLTNIEYEGIGVADVNNMVPSEGVMFEYEPQVGTRDRTIESLALNINAGGSVSVPGTLKFTVAKKEIADNVEVSGEVSIEIPDITCKVDASIGLLSGVNLNELVISITEKIELTGQIEYTAHESGYQLTETRWIPGKVELGRLPIALGTTGLSVDIVFFYNVSVKGSASITYSVAATQGIQVRNGSTRLIHDFSQSLDAIELKGSAKAGGGIAIRLNAFKLMDLIGIDGEIGLGISASFTSHISGMSTIYCADGTIYSYLTLELDTDTAFGMFIKTVWHTTYAWDIWDEDSSPYKLKLHIENGVRVNECTFGVGSISGYVHEAGSNIAIPYARVNLYSGNNLVKTLYSDSNGNFNSTSLHAGEYILKVSATGYQTFTNRVTIAEDQTTYVETLLMIDRSNNGLFGNVNGTLTDALTGGSVSEATYNVRNNWNNTSGTVVKTETTQNDGTFTIDLVAGNYTIEFVKSGYVTTSINVAIQSSESLIKHVTMSPETSGTIGGDIRIVLTWGQNPYDLDSHLYGPTVDGGSTFHTWFSNKDYKLDNKNIANLDLDDTSSYGPETTTIYELNTTGLYSFYIHDYSNGNSFNSTALSSSQAQVRVYSGNQLIATYNVPLSREGTLWHVFDYDVATDTLTAVNTFSYSNTPGSVRPDTLAQSLESSAMRLVPADKSVLDNLLNMLKGVSVDQFTAEQLKIIMSAEIIMNDTTVSQETVDELVKTLNEEFVKIVVSVVPYALSIITGTNLSVAG